MNLPRGTLQGCEECTHVRPVDYFMRVDSHFSGIVQFFKRGESWNVFFFLIENGFLVGFCAARGDNSLDTVLYSVIERCEVEMRTFCLHEMKTARSLNAGYLLPVSMLISDMIEENSSEEAGARMRVENPFQEVSFRAEINEARKFREDFFHRRAERRLPSAV